jgi:cold shock CspA family protein
MFSEEQLKQLEGVTKQEPINGKFKWFNEQKGFGFIRADSGEYFVHAVDIQGYEDGIKRLKGRSGKNHPCTFNFTVNKDGLRAVNVII